MRTEDLLIRRVVADMNDDAIRGIVESLVRGLADAVVEQLVESVLTHLADLGAKDSTTEPVPVAEGGVETACAVTSFGTPTVGQKGAGRTLTRTCELCGRVGQRRFEKTPTGGWRCSPTAKCTGRPAPKTTTDPPCPRPATGSGSVAGPAGRPKSAPLPGMTARCTDCTRAWNLSGVPLDTAIKQHELRNAHIVEVLR